MLAGCGMFAMRVFKSSPFCLYSGKTPWSHAANSGIFALGEGKGGRKKMSAGWQRWFYFTGGQRKSLEHELGPAMSPVTHWCNSWQNRALCLSFTAFHPLSGIKMYIYFRSLSLPLFVFFLLQLTSITRQFLCCFIYSLKVPINFLYEIRELSWICISCMFVSLNTGCQDTSCSEIFSPVFCKQDMFYFHCWKAIWVRMDTEDTSPFTLSEFDFVHFFINPKFI